MVQPGAAQSGTFSTKTAAIPFWAQLPALEEMRDALQVGHLVCL